MSALSHVGVDSRILAPGAALVTRPETHLNVHELDETTWVVEHSGPRNALTIEPLDERGWVLQRGPGRRRKVRRIGTPEERTHLVLDERAARRDLPHVQMKLFHYMAGEHVAWLLKELGVNCVLDVGANIGLFGQMLRRRGYRGRIVSFEPLPHLAEKLRERAEGDSDWLVMPYALGDENTEAEMTVVDDQGTTSSLLPVSDFGKGWSSRLEGIRRETVHIRRLEDVFDEAVADLAAPRVFLKLDTQGYDLRAFTGAGARVKDLLGLQSEISSVPIYDGMPHMTESIAAYEAAGFSSTGIFPVTRDVRSHQIIEFDVVMARPEAVWSEPAPEQP